MRQGENKKEMTTIGRAEYATFPDLNVSKIVAKIDTGANLSAIWAHKTKVKNGHLYVTFFGPGSEFYTGEEHIFAPGDFSITRVANSFGKTEMRYKVKLRIRMKGRLVAGTFTLADRSKKMYPILIGCSLLRNKFIVDVAKGSPLREAEDERQAQLERELKEMEGEYLL